MSNRRDFLRRAATLGGAATFGALAMNGFDKVLASPPPGAVGYINRWQMGSGSCVVFKDSGGTSYVKDTGIGSQIGDLIVDGNLVTSYGASLGSGNVAGASTTTSGIQEAVNALRGTAGLGGGTVNLSAAIFPTTSTINTYPSIAIRGPGGLLSAFQNIGACAIQPANSLNAPVINVDVDPNNTGNVVFPRLEGFAINGGGVVNTSQDGIKISKVNGNILDVYIRDVGVFSCGGTGLNIQCNGTAIKTWVDNFYIEDCLRYGIDQNGGYLRLNRGYSTGNTLGGVHSTTSQLLEIYNHSIVNNAGGAVIAAGAISEGVNIQGCRIDGNGGTTTPQMQLSALTSSQALLVAGNKFTDARAGGSKVNNHIVIGNSSGGSILSNQFSGSANVAVDPGAFNILYIRNNYGLNPLNKITNPFNVNNLTYLGGGAAIPTASTDYGVYTCDMFINAADSSNANNAILVKDNAGNTIIGPVSTLTGQFVPIGYKVNWGAFTGTAGAVACFGN